MTSKRPRQPATPRCKAAGCQARRYERGLCVVHWTTSPELRDPEPPPPAASSKPRPRSQAVEALVTEQQRYFDVVDVG